MKSSVKLVIVLVLLILMSFCSAASFGTFKQNNCIELRQTCNNCTYNNISSILYPNSTISTSNVAMTQSGVDYNFTFCNTTQTGIWLVNGFGDINGVKTVWKYDFLVTYSGHSGINIEIALVIFLSILIVFCIALVYFLQGLAKMIPIVIAVIIALLGLNILASLAESSGYSVGIITTLWNAYKYSIYGFWITILLVLITMTIALFQLVKWQKMRRPQFKTPMQTAKDQRHMRTGRY